MYDGQYRLTEENKEEYKKKEFDYYTTFDYSSLNLQEDYEADYYAAAILNSELSDANPIDIFNDERIDVELSGASYISDSNMRNDVLDCHGTLSRNRKVDLAEYLRDKEFIGAKFTVNLGEGQGYHYLCFKGQKMRDNGRLTVYVYDESGEVVNVKKVNYSDLDNNVHQYVLNLSGIGGTITVILNGGYTDPSGSADSWYQFSGVYLY